MNAETERPGPERDAPDGWAYNPSAWSQRVPIVGLGIVGMAIASYLAAYQFGLVEEVWDPLFGNGTERVLNSRVSGLFPVPDALLGAAGYAADWVFGLVGGTDRYRTKPWAVILFGIAIVPFGGVSIALGLAMPALVGSWCFLCLASTLISIVMIPPSWDEIYATLQAIRRMRAEGASWWNTLMGRPLPGS